MSLLHLSSEWFCTLYVNEVYEMYKCFYSLFKLFLLKGLLFLSTFTGWKIATCVYILMESSSLIGLEESVVTVTTV